MGARDPHLEDSASTSRSPTSVIDHSHAVHSYSSKNNYHEISVKKKAHPKKYLGSSYPQKEEEIQQKKTRKHGGKTPTRCYPTALQTFVFISFVVALVSVIVSASLFLDFPIGKGYPLSTSSLPKNISLQKFLNKNSTDLEEFQAKLENFIIKIEKWVEDQLQMEDEKLVGELEKIKSEMEVALRDHLHVVANQLDKMDEHLQEVEQSLEILEEKGLLTVSEAMELINNALKEKDAVGDKKAVISLDDIRAATRRIIEAEIEKHSADGIGRVDYAASSGGGKVLGHSEGYYNGIGLSWRHVSNRLISLNHPLANEILQPRFGEPGKCLPLKGSDVFVIIGLRTPIFAEAISVEHVSKKVAYDLTSAPRQFKVYGSNSTNENQQSSWILLGEFTYDIFANKIIQTFNLLNGNIAETKISRAKLHILSNHGSQSHTCIYRVRVHGHE